MKCPKCAYAEAGSMHECLYVRGDVARMYCAACEHQWDVPSPAKLQREACAACRRALTMAEQRLRATPGAHRSERAAIKQARTMLDALQGRGEPRG